MWERRIGTDRKTGTVVAIKTFKHCTNGLEWFYLHTQIELLQKCHDPHVIGLQDVYDNDGLFHIVTELADGGDLQTYLKAHGPLDERTAGYFVREILGGLAYLHDTASIVHWYRLWRGYTAVV